MAEQDATSAPSKGQIPRDDVRGHVETRVRQDVASLIESADELRGLAATLDLFAGLQFSATPDELRQTAAGVRAVSTQAFVCASRASGISTRLVAWADLAGIVQPAE